MLEETLRAEAQVLHDMLGTHDTSDFMRRLAVRITQDAARPPRVRSSASDPETADPEDAPDGPAAPPPSFSAQNQRFTRPRIRRSLRRRPTPIVVPDPAAHPAAVRDHVRRLCEDVLRSDDVRTLPAFDSDYDERGARTFGCLLYIIDRHEAALYWWGFAAGADDALAAHLLAAHHAAAGSLPDARLWRTFARMLGYTERHLPRPVRARSHTRKITHQAPWDSELREFMTSDQLPEGLLAR
ncbi:hypothetical protein ACIHCQ_38185 [Streptomyces sp. NPDC052236]|uniref:hypothetical protein n=1 Tax=Streptomyces sp. NPDC052236 TaxID=3365686 RepID=UPI0037CE3AEB